MFIKTSRKLHLRSLDSGIKTASKAAFLLCVAALVIPADLFAITINWGGSFNDRMVDSRGNLLTNSYFFQLGAFRDGFVPAPGNAAQWASNWYVFDQASFTNQVTDDLGAATSISGYFTGAADFRVNGTSSSPFASASSNFSALPAYIWIYNSQQPVVGSSEWFLARSLDWTFPTAATDCCGGELPLEWEVGDLDNAPVFGTQHGIYGGGILTNPDGTAVFQTSRFESNGVSVPEPGTAWFGAGILGFIGFHRKRLPLLGLELLLDPKR